MKLKCIYYNYKCKPKSIECNEKLKENSWVEFDVFFSSQKGKTLVKIKLNVVTLHMQTDTDREVTLISKHYGTNLSAKIK